MLANNKKSDFYSLLHGSVVGNGDSNFKTILLAYGNPDYGQNPYEPFCNSLIVFCNTIEELVLEEQKWIHENLIGSGNFACTEVWDNIKNVVVGTLCYNGKFIPK